MTIETYTTWAKRSGESAAYITHPTAIGRKHFRRSERVFTADILRRHGFRLVSGGMMEDCTQLTETRGIRKTPRQAVTDFIEGNDYSHVVYLRDHNDYTNLLVWAK